MDNKGKKNLSDKELEHVAGGGVKEQLTAGVLGISALVSPINTTNAQTKASSNPLPLAQNTIVSQRQENLSIVKYLIEQRISDAQEKAFKITNDLTKKGYNNLEISYNLSSNRYFTFNPTPLEIQLDKDVKNEDLPLPNFTVENMQKAKNNVVPNNTKNVEFVNALNINALELNKLEECQDGDIVNLASQFNALESVSNEPTAVKYWYLDRTQGPYCALQSVAATKHREAAHLQNKLTDGLKEALSHCKIDGKPITEKYPELYKNGYLEMMEITNEQDMEQFLEFVENEKSLAKYMKVLMQWVKCEGTEKKQLQFFTAAPSFQGYSNKIWSDNSRIMNLRRKACIKLVEIQYRAMAQAAAIISSENGKNVRLHITMVGHGVFNNPPETVPAALKALKEELQGVDATVFLHNRPNYPNVWIQKGNLKELGIKLTPLDNWKNKNHK